jgi:hypothetical protein
VTATAAAAAAAGATGTNKLPSSSSAQIMTLDQDGHLCVWEENNLYAPIRQQYIKPTHAAQNKGTGGPHTLKVRSGLCA